MLYMRWERFFTRKTQFFEFKNDKEFENNSTFKNFYFHSKMLYMRWERIFTW